ncbi:MAG: hypothetical protein HXY40_19385 [Chloroflexi bacterium]|nr:hypothetical protein [Chloroflexota bacterium]
MDSTTQVSAILILLLTLVVNVLFSRRRRQPFGLRSIPAFALLTPTIGAAIEANHPLHLSYGSSALGGENTVLALASSELFYQVARQAAIGDTTPILTTSAPSTLPLAQDTLRRAYQSRGLLNRYHYSSARWYPAGPRSLAFAAALTSMLRDDDVHASVLVGGFGSELALIAEAAARRDQTLIAASDQPEGQAIAYVLADEALIGEEMFAAGAYLDENPRASANAAVSDVLRWLLVLALVVATLSAGNQAFAQLLGELLARLQGGG